MFSGSIVAVITPFKQGKIDFAAFTKIVGHLIQKGSGALVIGGSTGEGTSLSINEREELLKLAIQTTAGRVPIIAGCSSPSTHACIELVTQAELLGCSAVLVVPPFYIKPSQRGIVQHFQALYDHTHIPIIVYVNPGRLIVDVDINTVMELAKIPTVVGVKESHPDVSRIAQIKLGVKALKEEGKIPQTKPFSVLSGDSIYFAAALAMGADGCISVTANAYPDLSADLYKAWGQKDIEAFEKARNALVPLDAALMSEVNPTPVKYAMHKLGFCENEVRLPLTPITKASEAIIDKALSMLTDTKAKAA